MECEINWDAVSALATAFAALVALSLGVLPPIFRCLSERKLARKRTLNRMKTVQLVVKNYRLYNPQSVVQKEVTQYQYDTSNVKSMSINIDLYQEANLINELSDNLSGKVKSKVSETLDLLVKVSSGFPVDAEDWDRLETLIGQSIQRLESKF
ncbi:hypothetical protein [Vibrio nitrifigilis]|uniref:Uncharacterized protein n=1 Tax=Vibrio nitrifigilis TaxID=2789781 RepID=A0ABS0GK81_9VIBR|nr:hypothetical protein [Vibrio nitrifigilis]MBF9002720.1 hypothetical protein [Vibrio nitrifigilis]